MSSIPKKAFIFYSPVKPNQPIPNVDAITLNGSAGQIAFETNNSENKVLELLGLYDDNDKDLKSLFKSRFNDMTLAIISNNTTAKNIAIQLDCYYDTIQSIEQIIELKGFDVVFVDFTDYSSSIWTFVNDIVSKIDPTRAIQCILSPTTSIQLPSLLPFPLPKQSYTKKKGSEVTVADISLIYAYSHIGSGRIDKTTSFTEKDIQENGCNRTLLAWHLLAEISHKLGHVPKYGA